MKKILVLISLLFVLMSVSFSQTFDPVNHKVTWSISNDTSSQMYGCQGYHGGPPCGYYWHTGHVMLSITNHRTHLTSTSDVTRTGALATASVSLDYQTGDVISYSETNQTYCPVLGIWNGLSGTSGWFEYATTMSKVMSVASVGTLWTTYNVESWCANVPTNVVANPDWNPLELTDDPNPTPWGWMSSAICFSLTGEQPWSCSGPVGMYKYTTNQVPYAACTYTPVGP